MENVTTELIKTKEYLTQDEISSFKKINEDAQELIVKFGQIEYQIQNLINQKQALAKDLEISKTNEIKFFKKLEDKYGRISIDPNTAEITKL